LLVVDLLLARRDWATMMFTEMATPIKAGASGQTGAVTDAAVVRSSGHVKRGPLDTRPLLTRALGGGWGGALYGFLKRRGKLTQFQ